MPSFRPFTRSPMQVAALRMSSCSSSSMRFTASSPFDAICIGPPNGRYSLVFSKTAQSYPCFWRVTAVNSPPIPPPAMHTEGRRPVVAPVASAVTTAPNSERGTILSSPELFSDEFLNFLCPRRI